MNRIEVCLEHHLGLCPVFPMDFYRDLFPVGSLAEEGTKNKGEYCLLAMLKKPKSSSLDCKAFSVSTKMVGDNLSALEKIIETSSLSGCYISPVSYAGRRRKKDFARQLFAVVIEIDSIQTDEGLPVGLLELEKRWDSNILPQPTYIVSSGNGIHLYFILEEPLTLTSSLRTSLWNWKKEMTKKFWDSEITTLFHIGQIQYESIYQPFRIVGTLAKNKQDRCTAFSYGEKVTIDYLNSFSSNKINAINRASLSEAKVLYPEWYERRIVKEEGPKTYPRRQNLYDWWLRKVREGVTVGHRYFCAFSVAVYGLKCGIPIQEVEKDLFDLLPYFQSLSSDPFNPFTPEDIKCALSAYYDKKNFYAGIDYISSITGIEIERRKKGTHTKQECAAIARKKKQELKAAGTLKKEGRPSKKELISTWRKEHPNGRKCECLRELNQENTVISRQTIARHWDSCTPV